MVKTEHAILGVGVIGLGYLLLKGGLLGGNGGPVDGANPPGFDETENGTRSSITPKDFETWEERQQYFLDLPEDERPLSYFTGEPIDPTQPAGSPENPLAPLKQFGPIISWEKWYEIRNVAATGISKSEFVSKAKGFSEYKLELIRTRGNGGSIILYDSDYEDYFGSNWQTWQQAIGSGGGTSKAQFDEEGNFLPDGENDYPFDSHNSGYIAWINAGNVGGYNDWLATGKDSGYASYKAANPGGLTYYEWQVLNRPNYTVYRKPDGSYTDYWNGQYFTKWLRTDNPLLDGGGDGGTDPPPSDQTVNITDVSVSKSTAQRGETVVISVIVSNQNNTSKSFSVQFSGELTNATINGSLAANETKTFSFNRNINFEGTKTATLGGFIISVTGVVETGAKPVVISDLRASADSANQGERVDISYDVYNPNNVSVNWNAQFSGTLTTAYKSGILEPQQTQTITISRLINFEGTRSASLAGMTVSITGIPDDPYEPPADEEPKEPEKDVDYYASTSPWGTTWCCMVCNTCFATESEVRQHIKNTGHYA